MLDTFDGRVRRAGARLTRAGANGASTMAWQPRGGGSRLAVRLNQPVSFAWDLPDGPLQQALAPVIGVRRLLAQADAEEYGSLLDVLDDRRQDGRPPADRVGPRPTAASARRLATAAHHGHA